MASSTMSGAESSCQRVTPYVGRTHATKGFNANRPASALNVSSAILPYTVASKLHRGGVSPPPHHPELLISHSLPVSSITTSGMSGCTITSSGEYAMAEVEPAGPGCAGLAPTGGGRVPPVADDEHLVCSADSHENDVSPATRTQLDLDVKVGQEDAQVAQAGDAAAPLGELAACAVADGSPVPSPRASVSAAEASPLSAVSSVTSSLATGSLLLADDEAEEDMEVEGEERPLADLAERKIVEDSESVHRPKKGENTPRKSKAPNKKRKARSAEELNVDGQAVPVANVEGKQGKQARKKKARSGKSNPSTLRSQEERDALEVLSGLLCNSDGYESGDTKLLKEEDNGTNAMPHFREAARNGKSADSSRRSLIITSSGELSEDDDGAAASVLASLACSHHGSGVPRTDSVEVLQSLVHKAGPCFFGATWGSSNLSLHSVHRPSRLGPLQSLSSSGVDGFGPLSCSSVSRCSTLRQQSLRKGGSGMPLLIDCQEMLPTPSPSASPRFVSWLGPKPSCAGCSAPGCEDGFRSARTHVPVDQMLLRRTSAAAAAAGAGLEAAGAEAGYCKACAAVVAAAGAASPSVHGGRGAFSRWTSLSRSGSADLEHKQGNDGFAAARTHGYWLRHRSASPEINLGEDIPAFPPSHLKVEPDSDEAGKEDGVAPLMASAGPSADGSAARVRGFNWERASRPRRLQDANAKAVLPGAHVIGAPAPSPARITAPVVAIGSARTGLPFSWMDHAVKRANRAAAAAAAAAAAGAGTCGGAAAAASGFDLGSLRAGYDQTDLKASLLPGCWAPLSPLHLQPDLPGLHFLPVPNGLAPSGLAKVASAKTASAGLAGFYHSGPPHLATPTPLPPLC